MDTSVAREMDAEMDAHQAFDAGMGADGDASPYPLLAELRAKGPVHQGWPEMAVFENSDGRPPMYSAYSLETVRAVFADDKTFSSHCYEEIIGPIQGRTILAMDEPEHRLYRQLQQQAFTKTAMERWETELVGPLIKRAIDGFEDAGHADLVRQFFLPIPIRVIAALLGLPESDIPEFHRLGIELLGFRVDMDRALRASVELKGYFSELLTARRSNPRDDLITVLANAEIDGQRLSDEDIYGFLRNLLPAGAETTARSSSSLMYAFLTHRAQFEAVVEDRDLLPSAIEEGIRWETPLLNFIREVTGDTLLGGVSIPKGALMVVNLGSANHDEERWTNPETFDIFRERKPHIGFGHGAHKCLGMHLARLETTVMMNALIDRLPGLRLDPDKPSPYVTGMIFRSPPRLDVVWDR